MLFTSGFFPGETLPERLAALSDPTISRAAFAKLPTLLNGFLARAVDVVRARFGLVFVQAALISCAVAGIGASGSAPSNFRPVRESISWTDVTICQASLPRVR